MSVEAAKLELPVTVAKLHRNCIRILKLEYIILSASSNHTAIPVTELVLVKQPVLAKHSNFLQAVSIPYMHVA